MSEMNTTVETGAVETNEATGTEPKTYTEAEMQELLQRETDRRVSSALKKQEQKFNNKIAEAEKLRGMDEAQRRQYEYDQRIAELESREKDFALAQNKLEATKVLANRGLPVILVDYVVADDADTMLDNINTFEKAFKAAVADEVSRRMAGPAPKSTGVSQTGLTKEEFSKMNLAQQAELYKTNPTLYKELVGK
jgi:DNA polymerase II large subunit